MYLSANESWLWLLFRALEHDDNSKVVAYARQLVEGDPRMAVVDAWPTHMEPYPPRHPLYDHFKCKAVLAQICLPTTFQLIIDAGYSLLPTLWYFAARAASGEDVLANLRLLHQRGAQRPNNISLIEVVICHHNERQPFYLPVFEYLIHEMGSRVTNNAWSNLTREVFLADPSNDHLAILDMMLSTGFTPDPPFTRWDATPAYDRYIQGRLGVPNA